MASLPKNVRQAWEEREGPVILATVSDTGVPNIAYVSRAELLGDDMVVLADRYFGKTRRNLMQGGTGALLFRDRQGKSYQIKGPVAYHQSGPVFDRVKGWTPAPTGTLHGAVALTIEEVYSGVVAE